jgi:hypothetical protein
MIDIGTLGTDYSVAYVLNDSGHVVSSWAHLGKSLRGLLRRPLAGCGSLRFVSIGRRWRKIGRRPE